MKQKIMTIFLFTMMLVATSLWDSKASDSKKHILIAGDEEKRGSYLVEITREAFLKAGYSTEFIFVPWARALLNSIEGKYDVLLAAYYTQERAEKLLYSESIGVTKIFFLKQKKVNISYATMDDLKPYRIGHILGSKVNKEFDEAEESFLKIEYVSNTKQNIRKLLTGRLDLVVEKEERLKQLLASEFKNEAENLEFLYPPLQVNKFYNCVSKKRPGYQKIVEDFNHGLELINEDGTLSLIHKKYGITPNSN